jgi:capsular exopolysaccharide synthesis family protein
MSRIRTILDKAERDGGAARMRSGADEGPALTPIAAAPVPAPADVVTEPMMPAAAPDSTTAAMPGARVQPPVGRLVPAARLDSRLVAAVAPNAVAAEQYRALRTRILHADNGSAVHVILITSPGRGEGKTLTAANLAVTMAQDHHRRICLVDADLRHSQIHRMFGLPDAPGLADVLLGHAALDECLVFLEERRISVLAAGYAPVHPAELLGTIAMRRLLDTLRTQFDCVIMDAPAAAPLTDVAVLTPLVDSVVLVVRAGITAKPAIHEAVAAIDGAKLLGVVLNETA